MSDNTSEQAPMQKALANIRNAWIAAAVSATVTLAVVLISMSGESVLGFNVWNLADVALIAGLGFGIYRKSRVCAVIMLLYFLASKIVLIAETGKFSGGFLAIVFLYFYAMGVAGTFQFHQLRARGGAAAD